MHGVIRPADGKRKRRLTDDEYHAFGNALREAEAANIWPPAIAVAHFLAVTGWRSGEAFALRWNEIDLARRTATLGETKTGESIRPLSNAACDLLRGLPRLTDLVFPATRGSNRIILSVSRNYSRKSLGLVTYHRHNTTYTASRLHIPRR